MRIEAQHSLAQWPDGPAGLPGATAQRSGRLSNNQLEDLRPEVRRAPDLPQDRGRPGAAARTLVDGVALSLVGVARNLAEAFATLGGGVRSALRGDGASALAAFGMFVVKLVQTPLDGILMLGGKALSAGQTLIGVEPVGRSLHPAEVEPLRRIFGDSIDWSVVTIKEGTAGLLTMPRRPFVHGNTIYVPPPFLPLKPEILVHELVHVWQHQHGGTDYMSEALWAQYLGDGYDVAKGLREGRSWSALNPEQQAQLIQLAFEHGYFDAPGERFVYAGEDRTAYLEEALAQLRHGRGAP